MKTQTHHPPIPNPQTNWRPLLWLVAVCAFWGLASINLPTAQAQTATTADIKDNRVELNYPESITFHVQLAEKPTAVTLTYSVSQISCLDVSTQVPVEVTGKDISWTWEMIRSGNPPPGASLWWEWNITTADGRQITTPRQTLTFTDTRFTWQSRSAKGITLNWYAGGDVGETLLQAATEGLTRLQDEMGIELQDDVQFFIYGSSEDMRDAVLYIQDWAGGVAFSEYNIILIGVPLDIADTWGKSTVRHELAHLVVGQFGRSCVGGGRPTWLDEGLAVYAEGEPDDYILDNIKTATENNSFLPLRSLSAPFPAHSEEAGVAYSQSYSTVKFLLETYGRDKMKALLLAMAQGTTYDAALEATYGLNIDGIELAWRKSLGLPAREIPPTSTPISLANIPTVVPLNGPVSLPTDPAANEAPKPASADEPTSGDSGFCGGAIIPPFFLVLFALRRPSGTKKQA